MANGITMAVYTDGRAVDFTYCLKGTPPPQISRMEKVGDYSFPDMATAKTMENVVRGGVSSLLHSHKMTHSDSRGGHGQDRLNPTEEMSLTSEEVKSTVDRLLDFDSGPNKKAA